MSDDNVTWVAHSFWRRARQVTDRELDPGYRVDMVTMIQNREFDAPYITDYARRWAENMEDAVNGEFEAACA